MTRTYREDREKWIDLLRLDEETGEITIYSQDAELGFVFSEYTTTLKDMGYKSIADLKKQMKKIGKREVDSDRQKDSEINGLLNLARYRFDNNSIICDIPDRLTAYGFTLEEATSMVISTLGL